jgi:hypothetical protein
MTGLENNCPSLSCSVCNRSCFPFLPPAFFHQYVANCHEDSELIMRRRVNYMLGWLLKCHAVEDSRQLEFITSIENEPGH